MSTFNETFKLSIKDVELIEQSVRQHISQLSPLEMQSQQDEPEAINNHKKIIELMYVLGNLHNQKIWYGQTHNTGVPLG